jgi:hypothetical protein
LKIEEKSESRKVFPHENGKFFVVSFGFDIDFLQWDFPWILAWGKIAGMILKVAGDEDNIEIEINPLNQFAKIVAIGCIKHQ